MGSIDLKVGGVILATIGFYTLVANIIPQVQSEVPEVLAFGADVSADELVSAGEALFAGAGGCTACHSESAGARAPNLLTDYQGQGTIGARCGTRISGLSCKEYLHQALVMPTDHIVDQFPPIMMSLDRTMTQAQIWSVVAYLESNGGEVTVTGADIPSDDEAAGDVAAGGVAAGGFEIASTDPTEITLALCVMCHQIGDEGIPMGPPLTQVGARLTPEEIRRAILDPQAEASAGYEPLVMMMPPNFGDRLSATQLEALVGYLSGMQ